MTVNKETALQFKGGSCNVSMVGANSPAVIALFAREMGNGTVIQPQKTGHSL